MDCKAIRASRNYQLIFFFFGGTTVAPSSAGCSSGWPSTAMLGSEPLSASSLRQC
jgi:hypothetical protein